MFARCLLDRVNGVLVFCKRAAGPRTAAARYSALLNACVLNASTGSYKKFEQSSRDARKPIAFPVQ